MKVTYYGHSCFELCLNTNVLLFDPYITPNKLASHIDINTIEPDYILLSHGHEDHIADLAAIQEKSKSTVICIAEIAYWLNKNGIDQAHGMNIGGAYNFEFGRVKMVSAVHSSSLPDGSYGGTPAGFLVYADGKKIYFAGDTALTFDMKLLAHERIDFAFLPIGDNFTMGIEDAIIAASFIDCKNIIGMHYNTFPPIQINEWEAVEKFSKAGLSLTLLTIGESKDLI